jgi:hypothetical protein
MVPARRVATVTAVTVGLVGAGAVFGAAAGGLAVTAGVLITEHEVAGFAFGAFIGAPLGAIMAPTLAWTLLPRVPLGKMFVRCATGTVVGGVIGWIINPVFGLLGAVTGCLISCLALALDDPSGDKA